MSEATTPEQEAEGIDPVRRCVATTLSGRPCDRPPLTGGQTCYVHDPAHKGRRPQRVRTGSEALMTASETAEMLGWSTAAVYSAVRESRVPHVKMGRAIWFPREAIRRWLGATDAAGERDPAAAG